MLFVEVVNVSIESGVGVGVETPDSIVLVVREEKGLSVKPGVELVESPKAGVDG